MDALHGEIGKDEHLILNTTSLDPADLVLLE